MSASRDKTQKITFVYSNLYQIYKKKPDVHAAHLGLSRNVLKARELSEGRNASVAISSFSPTQLIGKRIARPAVLPTVSQQQKAAVESLKENLVKLNDLHSRLRFMLQELEELVKE